MKKDNAKLEVIKIDKEMTRLMDDLTGTYDDEKYQDRLKTIKELQELREKINKPKFNVSPEVVLTVAGNLIGIILILNHERVNVISSKALGLIMKSRV